MLLASVKSAVAAAQLDLNAKFEALKSDGEALQAAEPSIILPWDTYAPPADQRHYQIENCMDAVLKVLPNSKKTAITSNEVIERISALKLSYSPTSIRQSISNMKSNEYVGIKGHTLCCMNDASPNELGRPSSLLWKAKV